MFLRRITQLSLIAMAVVLTACGGEDGSVKSDSGSADTYASYYPLAGVLPSPNDLAFAGSEDGTLNASVDDPTDFGDPRVALNALDGFSTIAPLSFSFTEPVDGDSLNPDTVTVLDLGPKGGPVSVQPLTAGKDFAVGLSPADRNGIQAVVTPLRPLHSAHTYLVALGDGIEEQGGGAVGATRFYRLAKRSEPLVDQAGNSRVADLTDDQAQTMEGVRQQVRSHLDVLRGIGMDTSTVIASWTVTTQTIGDVLDVVRADVRGDSSAAVFVDASGAPHALTDTGANTQPNGAGNIYTGVLSGLPYYLEVPTSQNPDAILTDFWKNSDGISPRPGNPAPVRTVMEDIPVLVTMPAGVQPSGGWPVVIFQHGITRNRTDLLGIADALAGQGLAAVAIDLPLHGLVFNDNPCNEDPGSTDCLLHGLYQPQRERTFGVDLVDNETGMPGPDGLIDASGSHYINLQSLLTSRDNLRQAVSDLFAVTEAIQQTSLDVDNDGNTDFDPGQLRYLGHSLGSIVGGIFLAKEPSVGTAVLGMPGGAVVKLLDGSSIFGPEIEAGLESRGFTKGTPPYETFLASVQTAVDSGDPLNYATGAVQSRNVLVFEVVGGNDTPSDLVVPNNVVRPYGIEIADGTIPSPTAGTDPLVRTMGLTQVDSSDGTSTGTNVVISNDGNEDWLVRYMTGEHISLLDPGENQRNIATTVEMQTQAATFLANAGAGMAFTANSGMVVDPVAD